jgi:hypothetical protein
VSELELKRISAEGIPHALEKAERYRLLNDPVQSESICRDILAVDRDHQDAVRMLILALTDQFATAVGGVAHEARNTVNRLTDEYERAYFSGIIAERETRAHLHRTNVVRSAAYNGFRQAMSWYERAEALRPHDVDAILRWNSCVRAIDHERLEPEGHTQELPLE